MKTNKDILYYDRKTCELRKEIVLGDSFLKWAYQRMSGQLLSPIIFNKSWFTKILGYYFDSKYSVSRIQPTIDSLNINSEEFEKNIEKFTSFNDFFYRKLKNNARPFENSNKIIVSPADGRILVYENCDNNIKLNVKGANCNIKDLFEENNLPFECDNIAVIRLCPSDYHRFHFPCDGVISETIKIEGKYHSVNPMALDKINNVFCINKREYAILETSTTTLVIMEVGAFGVSGIEQTYKSGKIQKMDEKGYFKFGGSTVILFFKKDTIKFSKDLLENSKKGYETFIQVGETLATLELTINVS